MLTVDLLIKKANRNSSELEEISHQCHHLGLQVTSRGKATISCTISPEHFLELFGTSPQVIPGVSPGATDWGSSGGFVATELPIPETLRDRVELISMTPPATRF